MESGKKSGIALATLIAVILMASMTIYSGCGKTGDNAGQQAVTGGGVTPVPPDQVPRVGMMVCVNCHSMQTADWLTGHGANNAGRSYPLSAECQPCHDETGDGYSLFPTVFSAPRPTVSCESCHGGGANHFGLGPIPYPRPGYDICGKCHNSSHHSEMTLIEEYKERQAEGKGHISSINQEVFTDASRTLVNPLCARCHTNEGFKDFVFQTPGSTSHDALVSYFAAIPAYPASEMAPVQCGTCHNAHFSTTGSPAMYMPATVDNTSTTTVNEAASAEFNTCSSCHQLYRADGPVSSTITANAANAGDERVYVRGAYAGATDTSWTAEVTLAGAYGVGEVTVYVTGSPATIIKAAYKPSGSSSSYVALANNVEFRIRDGSPVVTAGLTLGDKWVIENKAFKSYHDPAVNPDGSNAEIISDTHAVVPGDPRQNTPTATGQALFFVNKLATNSCSACHNVHSTSIEINEQYADSGHGDRFADPWTHYNWKSEGSSGLPVGPGSDRSSCQKCHTPVGYVAFATTPTNYIPTNNDFSYLVMGTGNGAGADNGQMQALYCWACHTSVQDGTLRNPGAVTTGYRDMADAAVVLPNVSGSNVCMVCHSGRESGGSVLYGLGTITVYVTGVKTSVIRAAYSPTSNVSISLADGVSVKLVDGGGGLLNRVGSNGDKWTITNTAATDATAIVAAGTNTGNETATVSGTFTGAADSSWTVEVTAAGSYAGSAVMRSSYTDLGFINSHYLGAAGNLFGQIGFEYTGRSYVDNVDFTHPVIGTAATPGTGTNGPCVACHMTTDLSHRFLPVRDDGAGPVLVSTVCAVCHNGATAPIMTITDLEDEQAAYDDALDAFTAQAGLRGYYFSSSNPYIFTAPYDPAYTEIGACTTNLPVKNWQTGGTSTFTWTLGSSGTWSCVSAVNAAGTAGTGDENMGAAFNLNMMKHEPGIFVHNPDYARRLMYDSIDWLDNNALDDSVVTTLNALTTEPYKAGAIEYLLTSGTCVGAACRP